MKRENMQILHVVTTFNRGGAEGHLFELARAQVEDGFEVAIAHLRQEYNYWQEPAQKLGIRVFDLGLNSYPEIRPLLRLARLINKIEPAVVHTHLQPAELCTRLALLLSQGRSPAKFVISKHNDEPFWPGPGSRQLGRWVAARAHQIIAISEAVRQNTCLNDLGLAPNLVKTIHYGISPKPYQRTSPAVRKEIRSSWGATEEDFVIGTVARFVPQKALHVLLAGYAKFRQRAGGSSRLVLIGKGPLDKEYRKQAKQLGIASELVFAGFREDIPECLAALDTFALTSNYEGFGLVLIEAMAAGLPVIASKVSSIPEIVVHEKTGFIFPQGDEQKLAEYLCQLQKPDIRKTCGLSSLARVKQCFQLPHVWEQTRKVYEL